MNLVGALGCEKGGAGSVQEAAVRRGTVLGTEKKGAGEERERGGDEHRRWRWSVESHSTPDPWGVGVVRAGK